MDLQLYQVDAANYLVDFRNKGYYKADLNTDKQFNRIVRDKSRDPSEGGTRNGEQELASDSEDDAASEKSKDLDKGIVDVSSPFLFLECACRLIVELAGG